MEPGDIFRNIYLTKEQVLEAFSKLEPFIHSESAALEDFPQEEEISSRIQQLEDRLKTERDQRRELQEEVNKIMETTSILNEELRTLSTENENWKMMYSELVMDCKDLERRLQNSESLYKQRIDTLASELQAAKTHLKAFQGSSEAFASLSFSELLECEQNLFHSLQELQKYKSKSIAQLLEKEVSDSYLCIICRENSKSMMTRPCNHISVCEICINKIRNCPMCRVSILSSEKVFLTK